MKKNKIKKHKQVLRVEGIEDWHTEGIERSKLWWHVSVLLWNTAVLVGKRRSFGEKDKGGDCTLVIVNSLQMLSSHETQAHQLAQQTWGWGGEGMKICALTCGRKGVQAGRGKKKGLVK